MTPTGIVPSGRVGVKLFTLVEVVIAIGLMSVGLLSIIGLLPVSLQATRDSVAESYAGDNAEEFLHYLSLRLKMPGNDYANWDQYGKVLPTSKPSETEPSQTWSQWYSDQTTTLWSAGAAHQFHKVERRTPAIATPDFAAVYRVWRSAVKFPEYINGTWVDSTASEDVALMLNVEVSWPAGIPYDHRSKALYCTEIYKPVLAN